MSRLDRIADLERECADLRSRRSRTSATRSLTARPSWENLTGDEIRAGTPHADATSVDRRHAFDKPEPVHTRESWRQRQEGLIA